MSTSQPNLNMTGVKRDIDLSQALYVLKKRKVLIIILTLLSAIGAGLYTHYMVTPVYQANALLMVTVASDRLTVTQPASQNAQGTAVNQSSPMPVLTMNTYLGQLTSEAVMLRVLNTLALPGQTVGSLSSMIQATIVPDSNLIVLKVSNTNPVLAAQITNAVSDQYLKLMKELMFSSVVVISPASIPSTPVTPNKTMNIKIGFLAGLILSIGLAFYLEYMDNTLKSAKDINSALKLPVLGLIPLKTSKNTRQSQYGGN